LKALFPDISFDDKETVLTLNVSRIEAYPSHNSVDSMRGLTDVVFILLDEADFFPIGQKKDVLAVCEGYIGKPNSNPYIVMVSTPNKPEGMYETIEKLPQDQCLYTRKVMTYEIGLGKIYTEADIAKARESPSFPREYCGEYIGEQGDAFSYESIEQVVQSGLALEEHFPTGEYLTQEFEGSLGVDPGWGSSKFGLVLIKLVSNKQHNILPTIQVVYAEEYERPDFNEMINKVVMFYQSCGQPKIFIDSANSEVVAAVKAALNERVDYEKQIAILRQKHPKYLDLTTYMNVIPMSFGSDGRDMLSHTKIIMDNKWLAIHPRFNKLIIALRTATATDGLLHKAETSHDDLLDALRLSLQRFH
jgi:hypothetical protein